MKRHVLMLSILFFAGGLTASIYAKGPQDRKAKKEAKKEANEVMKEKRREMLEDYYSNISEILESRNFVLEADYLSDHYGNRITVNSDFNFLKVEDNRAVLQVSSNSSIGHNRLGGITVEGNISTWKVKKNPKTQSVSLSMGIISTTGPYEVQLTVNAEGNSNATVSGIRMGKLVYTGELVPLEISRAFEGSVSY